MKCKTQSGDSLCEALERRARAGLRQAAVILVGRALHRDDAEAGESHLYSADRLRGC